MVRAFEERRNFVSERLSAIQGVKLPRVDGAFYVFPDVSAFFGADASAEGFGAVSDVDELCRYILEKGQVALVPGSAFGVPECLRISYAASNATLEEALKRIETCLAPGVFHRNSSRI
jgi:aspartate/glutamate/aspartate-prephenate aminotransferase